MQSIAAEHNLNMRCVNESHLYSSFYSFIEKEVIEENLREMLISKLHAASKSHSHKYDLSAFAVEGILLLLDWKKLRNLTGAALVSELAEVIGIYEREKLLAKLSEELMPWSATVKMDTKFDKLQQSNGVFYECELQERVSS